MPEPVPLQLAPGYRPVYSKNARIRIELAPQLSQRAPKRFYDTGPAIQAIASASTISGVTAALGSMATRYGIAVSAATTSGTDSTIAWTALTSLANYKKLATYFAQELSKIPPDFITQVNWDQMIFTGPLTVGGSGGTTVSFGTKIYYGVTTTDPATDESHYRGSFHYSIFNVINSTWPNDIPNTTWDVNNPAGFTYGASGLPSFPYPNHPPAFMDDFSRTARSADKANVFAYQMETTRYYQTVDWRLTDTKLAAKVAVLRDFLVTKNSQMGTGYFSAINPGSGLTYGDLDPDLIKDVWYTIEYSDNGADWYTGRRADQLRPNVADPTKPIVWYDYEAVPSHVRAYRAVVYMTLSDGQIISSAPSSVGVGVLKLRTVWIKDLDNPSNNFSIPVDNKWQEIDRYKPRALVRPLDRRLPVVVSGVGGGDAFSITWTVLGEQNIDHIQEVMNDDERTWLVQTPRRQWYVRLSGNPSISEDMFSVGEDPAWKVTIPFVEVDPI